MVGSGDEEHIITRVIPGTDPLQNFEEDDPSQFIVIDDDTMSPVMWTTSQRSP